MNPARVATLILLLTTYLCSQSSCVSLPRPVAEELKPAAADQPNNFRKPKNE
jgi:hypothetical protein